MPHDAATVYFSCSCFSPVAVHSGSRGIYSTTCSVLGGGDFNAIIQCRQRRPSAATQEEARSNSGAGRRGIAMVFFDRTRYARSVGAFSHRSCCLFKRTYPMLRWLSSIRTMRCWSARFTATFWPAIVRLQSFPRRWRRLLHFLVRQEEEVCCVLCVVCREEEGECVAPSTSSHSHCRHLHCTIRRRGAGVGSAAPSSSHPAHASAFFGW